MAEMPDTDVPDLESDSSQDSLSSPESLTDALWKRYKSPDPKYWDVTILNNSGCYCAPEMMREIVLTEINKVVIRHFDVRTKPEDACCNNNTQLMRTKCPFCQHEFITAYDKRTPISDLNKEIEKKLRAHLYDVYHFFRQEEDIIGIERMDDKDPAIWEPNHQITRHMKPRRPHQLFHEWRDEILFNKILHFRDMMATHLIMKKKVMVLRLHDQLRHKDYIVCPMCMTTIPDDSRTQDHTIDHHIKFNINTLPLEENAIYCLDLL